MRDSITPDVCHGTSTVHQIKVSQRMTSTALNVTGNATQNTKWEIMYVTFVMTQCNPDPESSNTNPAHRLRHFLMRILINNGPQVRYQNSPRFSPWSLNNRYIFIMIKVVIFGTVNLQVACITYSRYLSLLYRCT